MLEKTIQSKIVAYCKQQGVLCKKIDSTSSVGFPDLVVVLPDGKVYFIELKTPTGKLSKLQERTINSLKRNHANVFVCRSLEEFKRVIK